MWLISCSSLFFLYVHRLTLRQFSEMLLVLFWCICFLFGEISKVCSTFRGVNLKWVCGSKSKWEYALERMHASWIFHSSGGCLLVHDEFQLARPVQFDALPGATLHSLLIRCRASVVFSLNA
jgi:hypothetical protein